MPDPPLILVVDDDVDSRALLELALSAYGFAVATAVNGLDAMITARRTRPRLILLDLAMPVLDGLGFLRAFRTDPANARVPVIVLTAAAERQTVLEAAALGAREYLLKSRFSMQDMLERVKRRLEDPGAATATAPAPSPASDLTEAEMRIRQS